MKKLNINGNLYYNLTDLVRSDYLMIVQITRHLLKLSDTQQGRSCLKEECVCDTKCFLCSAYWCLCTCKTIIDENILRIMQDPKLMAQLLVTYKKYTLLETLDFFRNFVYRSDLYVTPKYMVHFMLTFFDGDIKIDKTKYIIQEHIDKLYITSENGVLLFSENIKAPIAKVVVASKTHFLQWIKDNVEDGSLEHILKTYPHALMLTNSFLEE